MKNNKPKLAIIRGLPGSGKSTLAKSFVKKYNVKHFENDMYLYKDGKYIWSPEAVKVAAKQCFNDTMEALKSGESVVVSNVFISKKAIDRYINMAKKLGCDTCVFRIPFEYSKMHKNIHGVSDEIIDNMKMHFEDYPGEKEIRL